MALSEESAHKAKLEIRHPKGTMSFCMNLFVLVRSETAFFWHAMVMKSELSERSKEV
jgi:hypothetical protein